jgi:hypothetical protein
MTGDGTARMTPARRSVALLALLALTGAACSDAPSTPPTSASAPSTVESPGDPAGSRNVRDKGGSRAQARPGDDESAPEGASGDVPGEGDSGQGPGPETAEGPVGEHGWGESGDDAASWGGEVEDYPDLVAVEPVVGDESLDVTFTFAGELPATMPDPNTVMDVRFGMKKQGRAPARSFGVRAGAVGWVEDNSNGSWDGEFEIEGDRLLLRIALHELGDRPLVRWVATSQWAHRPVKGTTAYMVDTVPNQKPGRLPL